MYIENPSVWRIKKNKVKEVLGNKNILINVISLLLRWKRRSYFVNKADEGWLGKNESMILKILLKGFHQSDIFNIFVKRDDSLFYFSHKKYYDE